MSKSLRGLKSPLGKVEEFTMAGRGYVAFVPNSLSPTTPVLITHDAQNYMVSARSTWNGQNWGVIEAINGGLIKPHETLGLPLIVSVHLKDSKTLRWNELSPQDYMETRPDVWEGNVQKFDMPDATLMGNAYIDEVVEKLLPELTARYGVELELARTAIGGSSMGGVASLYAVGRHPQVFSAALAYSTHWVIGADDLVEYLLDRIPNDGDHLIWSDRGNLELDASYEAPHKRAEAHLQSSGWVRDENFVTSVFYGTGHNETYWSRRIELPINWWLSKL